MTLVDIMVVKYGMSMAEATLLEWLVEVGERVEAGEPVAQIETDKVEMAVVAPAGGILAETLVEDEADFPVPSAIGRIRTDGDG